MGVGHLGGPPGTFGGSDNSADEVPKLVDRQVKFQKSLKNILIMFSKHLKHFAGMVIAIAKRWEERKDRDFQQNPSKSGSGWSLNHRCGGGSLEDPGIFGDSFAMAMAIQNFKTCREVGKVSEKL